MSPKKECLPLHCQKKMWIRFIPACVEIMADDDNGVSMMRYIDYEDIIGVELIKN